MMNKPLCWRLALLVIVAPLLTACLVKSHSSHTQSVIPGVSGSFARLGSGYDPGHGRILPKTCIEGAMDALQRPVLGEAQVSKNASAGDILSKLSGGIAGAFAIFPGIDAGAELKFATQNSDNALAMTVTLSQAVSGTASMTYPFQATSDLASAVRGATDLAAARTAMLQVCGREFVNAVNYGASIVGAVTLSFDSQASKSNYQVDVLLSLLQGIGKMQGGMDINTSSFHESFAISLAVDQIGGRPEMLTKLFPDGLPTCRWQAGGADLLGSWLQPCRTAKNILVAYVTGASPTDDPAALEVLSRVMTFPQQLQTQDDQEATSPFVPLSYTTLALTDADINTLLTGRQLNAGSSALTALALDDERSRPLQELLEASMLAQQQRQAIQTFLSNPSPAVVGPLAAPSDDYWYGLFFATAHTQMSHVIRYQEGLSRLAKRCWQDARLCRRDDIQLKMRELRTAYPVVTDFLDITPDKTSFFNWCLDLGALAPGPAQAERQPRTSLAQGDAALVALLMAKANAGSRPRDLAALDGYCRTAAGVLPTVTDLNLNAPTSANAGLTSLRVLDEQTFANSLLALSLEGQRLHDFPVFFRLKNLRRLNISGNAIDQIKANPGRLALLPPSLQSFNASCLPNDHSKTSRWLSNQMVANVRTPVVILRGHTITALAVPQTVEQLVVTNLSVALQDVLALADARDRPLTILIAPPEGNPGRSLTLASGQRYTTPNGLVTIATDPQPASCD